MHRAHHARRRPLLRVAWIAALLTFVLPATIVSAASPLSHSAPSGAVPGGSLLGRGLASAKLAPRLQTAQGPVTVFIELAGTAAIDASDAAAPAGKAASQKAAKAARAGSHASAAAVVKDLHARDPKVRTLYQTTDAVSGVAVVADAASLRAIAARADVASISTIVPKKLALSNTAVLTRAIDAWRALGTLGANVKVGVIDTGIDYTHANFGGAGTIAAYKAIDSTTTTAAFPNAKVVGGYDFVGNAYDAGSDDPAVNTPVPDPNPLDCEGHGSHVAGIAAGLGVNADGTTFTGNYRNLTASSLAAMKIGPGMAPKASLYALKVFGCEGSVLTSIVGAALDWSLDPNRDGDFSDHLDVVNLSLGTDYAAPDDPETKFVANVTKHGVLAVYSAGNGGDLYDIGNGAPESLDVAAVSDSRETFDAVEVTAPSSVAGIKRGQYSAVFDYAGYTLTKPVVKMTSASNLDGCDPFSATDKATVAGKFVWLEWDDDDATRRCGSAGRSANAVAAGAAGAVFTSTLDHFPGGITGSAVIPVFQFTGSVTTALRPALNAGTLIVKIRGDLLASIDTFDSALTDQAVDFTSRGTRTPGPKPDVAAPGDTVISTLAGSGNGRVSESGTSMAAPHIAGIAALVHGVHPTWTPGELKAAIMNTANHDVFAGRNQTGPIEAPNRVGSGRVDALDALNNKVLAFDKALPNTVSVGFGVVEVGAAPVTIDRTIKVANKGTATVKYAVSYKPITTMPGVAYQLDKTSLTIPGGGSAEIRVRLRIADPTALRKSLDPTVERFQLDLPREWVADASGLVILKAISGSTVNLRVPVYAAPKPTADITVPGSLAIHGKGPSFLELSGRGLDQGTIGDDGYLSLYGVLELGATSPKLPDCGAHQVSGCTINGTAKGGDIRYVGAGSNGPAARRAHDPASAEITFGVVTWANWASLGGNTIPFVDFDVNGDHVPDFETYVQQALATDILLAWTVDLHTGETVDVEFANDISADVDSNTFDTNVILMPVYLDTIGIDATKGSHRITYQVGVAGFYRAPNDSLIDLAPEVSFDPLKPGLWADDGDVFTLFDAVPGTGLDIQKDDAALKKDKSDSLLVINLHNSSGQRAAVVKITP